MFKQTKQILIVIISFIIIAFFFFLVFVPTIKDKVIEEEKNLLKNYVEIEVQRIEHHIQSKIKGVDATITMEYLRERRFGTSGEWYFFIINLKGATLLHPTLPETIGASLEKRNDTFKLIFSKAQDALKSDGFVEYKRPINNDQQYEDAIAFVAYIPEYDWILGASFALKDVINITWTLVIKLLPTVGILILFIMAILFYVVIQSSKIAAKKNTQIKLDSSEEKYKTIFEESLSAFSYHQVIYDEARKAVDYKFLETNKEFEKLTGLTGVEGKTIKEINPSFIEEGWLDIYAKVAETGEKLKFNKFSATLEKWFSVYAYSAKKGYFVSMFDDITESKRNEERIADLAKFPEENPNPVLRIMSDGSLAYANNTGKIFVKEIETPPGNFVSEECFKHIVECLSSKKALVKEMKIKDSIFSMTFSPGIDFSYVNVYGTDITEMKRVELALKQSEQNYAITFQSIGDGVIVLDNNFKITMINKACKNIIGYDEDFCVGKTLLEIITLPENDNSKKRIESIMEEVSKDKRSKNLPPLQFTRKSDNEAVLLEDSISPIIMSNGENTEKRLGYVVVFRDIYEEVQSKNRTEELEEQLHQARKMEAIDQFSGGIAHDFNNILTVIQGFTEIMLIGMEEDNPFYENLREIKNSCVRAANLTEKLLTLSKKQTIHTQIVDINEIISDYLEIAKRLTGGDIEIRIDLKSSKTIKADTSQLDQILLNCTSNARDAIKERAQLEINCEKKILITTYDTSIENDIQSSRLDLNRGEYIVLEIKDTGRGIDNALKAKIFEPFFTTKAKGKRTGLGLSTVYGIVKQNGGSIFVYSEPNQGATFKIFWPVSKEKIIPVTERQKEVKNLRGEETILIVEDEIEINKLTTKYLKSMGYIVYSAANGEEALETIRSHLIDLVITDILMPKMGGYELIEELKKLNKNIKFILASGYTPDTFIENNSHFIGKPYSLYELASKVRTILDSDNII